MRVAEKLDWKGLNCVKQESKYPCDKWVTVTTAWRIFRLQMEEWPPIWRVAMNILNKQSRTANKGGRTAWGLG
jgi:hypothetical protein